MVSGCPAYVRVVIGKAARGGLQEQASRGPTNRAAFRAHAQSALLLDRDGRSERLGRQTIAENQKSVKLVP